MRSPFIVFNAFILSLSENLYNINLGEFIDYIEGATVNNSETYEMPGLDINDFVSTILHWSNEVEVLMLDESV